MSIKLFTFILLLTAKLSIIMRLLLLLLFSIPLISKGQVLEDFSDGNFTSDPQWFGDTSKYKINKNYQLQLNDTTAGTAFLATTNAIDENCEWRFWVKQSFSPSGNNYGRIYLMSDNNELTGNIQGYFLQLGESGSNDAPELFKQNGETTVSVCRGTNGLISSSFALSFKITRDSLGKWNIFVDKENNGIYLLDASGVDNTYNSTKWFGFYCKYTSSNSTKFYFDDIYVGEIIIDNQPPEVNFVTTTSDSTLNIVFNEPVDETTATTLTNYYVDNDIGNPVTAEVNGAEVKLIFDAKFKNEVDYELSISNITDLEGNEMIAYHTVFSYYSAKPFDIVFNEIFPDPTPTVGLPEYEFIELYNRSSKTISLNGWTLIIGNSEKVFENASIAGKGFLIIGKNAATDDYSQYGQFYGFSSFSLTNTGQTLTLLNQQKEIISQVSYNKSWYHNSDKEDGGWSIEQINPDNICSDSENWKASNNNIGGTPGNENSVYDNIFLKPKVANIEILSEDVLEITFNQKMNKETLENVNNFYVNNNIGNPAVSFPDNIDYRKTGLFFNASFKNGILYNITIDKDITNCAGVSLSADTIISFGIPDSIKPLDIIINEILFYPMTNGTDYVELYNRSDKLLDISQLKLATVKLSPPNPPDTIWYDVIQRQTLFFPGNYLVLTKSPEAVKNQYIIKNPEAFLTVEPFPTYNNYEGTAIIATNSDIIDSFTYNDKMHYPLLNYVQGVSLERINPDGKSQDPTNWHSAAEDAGFGTPGYKNSQYFSDTPSGEEITIEPEIFSPDNDGYNDIINIIYNFKTPGYNLNVRIFDRNGRLIRTLVDSELVGTSGNISWDGITDDNTKAPVGIYIFYIKAFDSKGNVNFWKKTGILATKWK
jgi:gliding motility-associated-like protein